MNDDTPTDDIGGDDLGGDEPPDLGFGDDDDSFTSDDEGKTLSSTPFNFNDSIEGNITLYAGWFAPDASVTMTLPASLTAIEA